MTAAPNPTAIALTLGDPRGIGPEVMIAAAARLRVTDSGIPIRCIGPDRFRSDFETSIGFDPSLDHFVGIGEAGTDDSSAGANSVEALREAVRLALAGEVGSIVTGPVSKPALWAAGARYPGQTELLADWTGAPSVGMLMAAESTALGGALRVLLATTHLALRLVPDALTEDRIVAQGRLLDRALRIGWRIPRPTSALCAMNPHASDGGLFGDEEERVMAPALGRLRDAGIDVRGPIPADTVFSRALAGEFDAVLAPYHDVGMAAFKTVSFGGGVNVTLGLPFVRTSPDHGTAFDLVGTGRARSDSAYEAMALAVRLQRGLVDKDHPSERTLKERR